MTQFKINYCIFIVAYTLNYTDALRASQRILQAKTSSTTTTTETISGYKNEEIEVIKKSSKKASYVMSTSNAHNIFT